MTRPLVAVGAGSPVRVLEALRDALAGGPAVLPLDEKRPATADASPVPLLVQRRVSVVIETSGSTSAPKRVALTADALLASAAASGNALGGQGQWLLALPAHYVAGVNVLVRSIAAGIDPVILPPGPFDVAAFASAAATLDSPLRFTALVPAQLARLVDAIESGADDAVGAAVRRFDRILVGGQSVPERLLERASGSGLRVTRTYGASETAGGCVYDGVTIGTTVVRVADGEVEVSGPTLAEGYLDDPDLTARRFVTDAGARWYRTGDSGVLRNGVLTVTGRLDRVLISGGVKVALDEVERVVRSIPRLEEVVVVPAPDPRWGEVPVVVAAGDVDLVSVRSTVVEVLGRAAAPARVIRVAALPLLASGKPDLAAMAALALDPEGARETAT